MGLALAVCVVGIAPAALARAVQCAQLPRRVLFASPVAGNRRERRSLADLLGRRVRRLVGRPNHQSYDQRIGAALLWVPASLLVDPVLGLLVLVLVVVLPVLRSRRDGRVRDRTLLRELPEVVDLYSLAIASGHTIATASQEVANRVEGVFADGLQDVMARVERGQPLDESLQTLNDAVGPRARPLMTVLMSGLRYGVPVAESLQRIAVDLRLERRRHAENAARRLPVVMLFPLVLCVLPAFGLLTVVPVLIDSLQSMSL